MLISESVLKMSCDDVRVAAGEYLDYRDRNRSFAETAAYQNDEFNLTGAGAPLRVNATPERQSRNNQMMVLEILWYQTIRRAVRTFSALLEERAIEGGIHAWPWRGPGQRSSDGMHAPDCTRGAGRLKPPRRRAPHMQDRERVEEAPSASTLNPNGLGSTATFKNTAWSTRQ